MHATHFPLHCSTLLISLNLMQPAGWWEGNGGGARSELHDTVLASPHTSSHTKHRIAKPFIAKPFIRLMFASMHIQQIHKMFSPK